MITPSSTYNGKSISFTITGASHAPEISIEASGLPAGERIDAGELCRFMKRRAPGNASWATPRKEADKPEFLAGIGADGALDGGTLMAVIRNASQRPADYRGFIDTPRPSHADFTARAKYGDKLDMAGGGPFSGRMTAPLCILGGICKQILERRGVAVAAHITKIGHVAGPSFNPAALTKDEILRPQSCDFPAADDSARAAMIAAIDDARRDRDSVGGIVECAAVGVPPGIGGFMYDALECRIAHLAMGIPAVRGIEFGAGFDAAGMRGSAHNDPYAAVDGKVATTTNNHGGIIGGITSGMPLIFRVAFKPTPSIAKEQQSVSLSEMKPVTLSIGGRHDPCIVPRALPVVESALAIALMDEIITNDKQGK